MRPYLNTEEAAAYLGLKERKLYELAATGGVPCSKATGKWLFPRAALDRWVEAAMAGREGAAAAPPDIIGGSHDLLLEWAVRRSACGLALLSEGSGAGLARLDRDEVALAALHLHGDGGEADANREGLCAAHRLHDAVLISFARREQGLLAAPGNPLGLAGVADAARAGARMGRRPAGSGAQQLLDSWTAEQAPLAGPQAPYATDQDLAFGLRNGDIDCGVATRAVAAANGLSFVSLAWERFDLALRRRTYFEPGPQKLFAFLRTAEFARQAALFGGYDVGEAGAVRFNR